MGESLAQQQLRVSEPQIHYSVGQLLVSRSPPLASLPATDAVMRKVMRLGVATSTTAKLQKFLKSLSMLDEAVWDKLRNAGLQVVLKHSEDDTVTAF